MRRRNSPAGLATAVLAVLAVAVVSLGSAAAPDLEEAADAPPAADHEAPGAGLLPLPVEPSPGEPGAGFDPSATLSVWAGPDLPADFGDRVAALPAVTDVVAVRRGLVHLTASWTADSRPVDELPAGFAIAMQAAAFEPDDYAPLVQDGFVEALRSLYPGSAVLSASAAELRQAEEGSVLAFGDVHLAVGAIVSDEVAGSSELLVTPADADRLGGFDRSSLIVRHDGDEAEVTRALAALAPPDVNLRIRSIGGDDANPRLVRPDVVLKQRFGEFAHGPVRADGHFALDPAWVEANIAQGEVPILGRITCHREFLPLVVGALGELEERGLAHLVDASDYGGCWHPRMTTGGTSISRHAWGVAIDLNASTNPFGSDPVLDPRVVAVFERWGMRWGGDFLTPDGMHFEYYDDPS